MKYCKIYLVATAFLLGLVVKAQQEISMYYLGNNIYQSVHLNPAFMPEKDNYSFISHYFNFSHSGFALENVFVENDTGGLVPNIDTMLAAMNPGQNFLNVNNTFDLFSVKWKRRRNYYGFNVQEKMSTTFSYPKDFFTFALKGWGSSLGDSLDLGLGLKSLHYREYSFNFMKKLKRWDLGFRAKFLTGLSALNTKSTDAFFHTDSTDLSISANYAYRVDMSGGSFAEQIDTGGLTSQAIRNYLLNFNNIGVGFDFGGVYKIDNKLRLSISLLDIGSINWRSSDVANLTVSGNQSIEGLDLINIVANDSIEIGDQANVLLDTIVARNSMEWTNNNFTTNLVPKHYIGIQYNLIDSLMFGAVWYGEFYKGYRPGLSVGLTKQFAKFINLGINYSIKNRSYANLGGSVVLNFGPLQIYAMTDNFYSMLDYQSVRNLNLRWGLNARFRLIRPRYRAKEG